MMIWNRLKNESSRTALNFGFLMFALLLLIAFHPENPKVRQPLSVGGVEALTKPFQIKKNMQSAKKSAERIDKQASHLMKVQFMSSWARWRADISLDDLREQYSRDLTTHLKAMASLMKFRREGGGHLPKLQEFDFQNLVRKSDHLLALPVSKTSFQYLEQKAEWQSALAKYNQERMIFDSQRIIVADN